MPIRELTDVYQLNPTDELPVEAFMRYDTIRNSVEYTENIKLWLRTLSAKYGRTNVVKVSPPLQRGINLVYSHLEEIKYSHHYKAKQSLDFDILSITEEPLWLTLTELIPQYFPELVKVVKPGRVPAEAIRDKSINRTFYNFVQQKQRIIQEIRSDLINQGELGRLKIKIIEAQIAAFHNTYSRRCEFNNEMWRELKSYQYKRKPFHCKGATTKHSGKASAADASLEIDMSAELFNGLKVEVEKTWDFSKVNHKVKGSAFGGGKAKVTGKLFAKFGRGDAKQIKSPEYLQKNQRANWTDEEIKHRKQFHAEELIPGVDIGVNVELAAMVGVKIEVKHEMTVGQIMAMSNEAELFIGAEVKATATGHISSGSMMAHDEIIVGKIGAKAFAGLSLKGSSSVTFKARGINAAAIKASGSLELGIGVKGEVEAALHKSGDLKFRVTSGATLGVGTTVGVDTMVNPVVFKVMLWDGFIHYFTTRSYQQRMDRKLDCKVNTVAVTRCGEMAVIALNVIDQEYHRLSEELWRIPTNANFSNGIYSNTIKRSPSVTKQYLQSVQANSKAGVAEGVETLNRSSAVIHRKFVRPQRKTSLLKPAMTPVQEQPLPDIEIEGGFVVVRPFH